MNLAHIIDDHAAERVALVSQGRPLTYGALRAAVESLRAELAGLGIEPGERVAIVGGNSPSFVVGYLAVLGLGAVAVPLNPASPAPELVGELSAVDASVVLVVPVALDVVAGIDREAVPSVRHVVLLDGGPNAAVGRPGVVSAEELSVGAIPTPVVEVEPSAPAVLVFTSGTAGSPRAACLTHGNLLANIQQSQASPVPVLPDDVLYGVLPLHHIFGLNVVLGIALQVGAAVVLVQRFDPATALDTIAERGVTVVPGAPPMWVAWASMTDLGPDVFRGVRLALSGAAHLPEDAAARLHDRFGLVVSEGYGLTEAGPTVTSSAGLGFRPGSIGKVLPGMDVRLVDETGTDVLAGDPGEIWVKGPNVFAGYWHDDEATARALDAGGWLHTGDIAVSDDDGVLHLVDRAKDLIIVSGFNVYPAEVEDVLADFPGVAEVAVVGVPHPHTGEAIRAYVVATPGAVLDEEQLIMHCGTRLARYKCPAKVLFVTELPRGPSGKLLRRNLQLG